MILKILIGLAVVVAVLLVVVATRPPAFHVERSIVVAAPPESAFAQVNDFRAWAAWSPYEKLDPGMKRTFGGSASGTGATYGWSGNDKAGEGRMAIAKSESPSRIAIELEFIRPFAGKNVATFTFVPAPDGTRVTWAMDGQTNFAMRAASLVFSMDKLLGSEFERGLAALKTVAESAPRASAGASTAAQ